MPPLLRSLLPPIALTAIAVVCAGAVAQPLTGGVTTAQPIVHRPNPTRRVPRPAKPAAPTPGERIAAFALEAVGVPYRWGGASPEQGFDCSGLVHWSYARLDIEVPHSSYALHEEGRPVNRSRLEPGDVLFFSGLGHVGLYVGRGRMVHAPHSGRRVEVVRLSGTHYGKRLVAARRLAPDASEPSPAGSKESVAAVLKPDDDA
jgi:murein DD-endopeptidase